MLPDDDLVQSPPYMELSDGEEECDSIYSPPSLGGSDGRLGKSASENAMILSHQSGENGINPPRNSLIWSSHTSHEFNKSKSAPNVTASASVHDSHEVDSLCTHKLDKLQTRNLHEVDSLQTDSESDLDQGMKRLPTCTCDFRKHSYEDLVDEEGRALLQILELPSTVYATRQPVDLEQSYPKAKRIILRDVLRTDRNFHYFRLKEIVVSSTRFLESDKNVQSGSGIVLLLGVKFRNGNWPDHKIILICWIAVLLLILVSRAGNRLRF